MGKVVWGRLDLITRGLQMDMDMDMEMEMEMEMEGANVAPMLLVAPDVTISGSNFQFNLPQHEYLSMSLQYTSRAERLIIDSSLLLHCIALITLNPSLLDLGRRRMTHLMDGIPAPRESRMLYSKSLVWMELTTQSRRNRG
jgi:hypothetical protein